MESKNLNVEDLEVGQHISCMYMLAKSWGVTNGIVRKITPKTFVVDTKSNLITIKKQNIMTLKFFGHENKM